MHFLRLADEAMDLLREMVSLLREIKERIAEREREHVG